MRRLHRLLAPLLLLAVVAPLAGCGSSDEPGAPTTTSASAPAGSFPAEVVHKFGTTIVPSAPKRIVVAGLTEQDTVLALGSTPIATTEWYGKQPYATWPWARAKLGAAEPTVLSSADGFEFEKIAALRPDLIIGVNAGMKRADYAKLSKLAPTIAPGVGSTDYFSPWDQQVALIAQALGKPAAGRALVARVKDDYAKVAAAHPDLEGKTVTFSQNAFYDGELYVYPEGLGTDFLQYLGMTINPKVTKLAKTKGEQVPIAAERLGTIDADAIVFATEKASDIKALNQVTTFRFLDAVSGRRAVFTDPVLSAAMYFLTPLSLEYVLEHLPDQLSLAVAGRAPRRLVGGA